MSRGEIEIHTILVSWKYAEMTPYDLIFSLIVLSITFVHRLKAKIKNELLDSFIVALELLCSPELVIKVRTVQPNLPLFLSED